jgi:hypothetical protein
MEGIFLQKANPEKVHASIFLSMPDVDFPENMGRIITYEMTTVLSIHALMNY